jgi:hypothetical protein
VAHLTLVVAFDRSARRTWRVTNSVPLADALSFVWGFGPERRKLVWQSHLSAFSTGLEDVQLRSVISYENGLVIGGGKCEALILRCERSRNISCVVRISRKFAITSLSHG